MTLTSETASLSPRLMTQLRHALEVVRVHAKAFWQYTAEHTPCISITKIDIAIDLHGSFLPSQSAAAREHMKRILGSALNDALAFEKTNFMGFNDLCDFKVVRGANNLQTSFQYAVKAADGADLLRIKAYDKTLDLFCRDRRVTVGSRIASVLGARRQITVFDKRVRVAQHCGLTRLEISVCRDAIQRYNPWRAGVRVKWDTRAGAALHQLADRVLND